MSLDYIIFADGAELTNEKDYRNIRRIISDDCIPPDNEDGEWYPDTEDMIGFTGACMYGMQYASCSTDEFVMRIKDPSICGSNVFSYVISRTFLPMLPVLRPNNLRDNGEYQLTINRGNASLITLWIALARVTKEYHRSIPRDNRGYVNPFKAVLDIYQSWAQENKIFEPPKDDNSLFTYAHNRSGLYYLAELESVDYIQMEEALRDFIPDQHNGSYQCCSWVGTGQAEIVNKLAKELGWDGEPSTYKWEEERDHD